MYSGMTPLTIACNRGSYEAAEALCAHGAELDARDDYQSTPLMNAAYAGRTKICEMLLALGADPSLKDKHGKTALDHARGGGHRARVRGAAAAGHPRRVSGLGEREEGERERRSRHAAAAARERARTCCACAPLRASAAGTRTACGGAERQAKARGVRGRGGGGARLTHYECLIVQMDAATRVCARACCVSASASAHCYAFVALSCFYV
eukprot:COSAG06_NODE_1320_length_9872_cov_49.877213_10_plen_209_part_00